MPIYLKQSTASQEVALGYFVDSTDGNTEETGLTIANTDIKIHKAGATTLANKNSGGATHISNGVYYAVLDATDTDTAGPLVIFVHVSGALPVRVECVVLVANVYDSMIAGSDALQVHANEITAGLITAAAIATGAIDADATAADFLAEINAEVVDALATDTYAEPTGVPAATASLATKIGVLHMAHRNKVTVTASKKTVYDDSDAAEYEFDLQDDGSTFTSSEANSV